VEDVSWDRIRQDVEPFLEASFDTELFTRENLIGLLL
jgi:hypothetical protein